jgi:hypothetical protein
MHQRDLWKFQAASRKPTLVERRSGKFGANPTYMTFTAIEMNNPLKLKTPI